jgi:hypothetical protein
MFRAAVLSVALTLAIVPNVTVWCAAWCQSEQVPMPGCQHDDLIAPSRVTEGDGCRTAVTTAMTFVRDEAPRQRLTTVVDPLTPHFEFVPSPAHLIRWDRSSSLAVGNAPVLIPLRL